MEQTNSIFLIDDDRIMNYLHETIIQHAGFQTARITAYEKPLMAIADLKKLAYTDGAILPGIIFLDINMPIMDAWEFLEEFEKLPALATESSRIFIVSSSVNMDDVARSKNYRSVHGFISKPIKPERLIEIMGRPVGAG